jgi:cytoskeletal protein RodZ
MTTYRVAGLIVTVTAAICLATAQSSQLPSSSGKSSPNPLHASTKPLTPKSAMPTSRKASGATQNTSKSSTTAELVRLEQPPNKAAASKSGTTAPGKPAPIAKSTGTSDGKNSGINFKYQKPVGGLQATPPGARSANSSKPRVKKN